jgi:hypothetical protein
MMELHSWSPLRGTRPSISSLNDPPPAGDTDHAFFKP